MDFFGMGWGEILLILIVAVIFLGPGKIVNFASSLGRFFYKVKKLGSEITAQIEHEANENKESISSTISDLKQPTMSERSHHEQGK